LSIVSLTLDLATRSTRADTNVGDIHRHGRDPDTPEGTFDSAIVRSDPFVIV